eukprot:1154199-Pelagomonas_calceolata.AAC.5
MDGGWQGMDQGLGWQLLPAPAKPLTAAQPEKARAPYLMVCAILVQHATPGHEHHPLVFLNPSKYIRFIESFLFASDSVANQRKSKRNKDLNSGPLPNTPGGAKFHLDKYHRKASPVVCTPLGAPPKQPPASSQQVATWALRAHPGVHLQACGCSWRVRAHKR